MRIENLVDMLYDLKDIEKNNKIASSRAKELLDDLFSSEAFKEIEKFWISYWRNR